MTYIYDLLLNFTDDERILEFFEWNEKDEIINIKKIPLIRVSNKTMKDFINKKVKVTEELLLEIKNKTTTYSKTEDLEYALLISDLNKVIAIEFNKKGEVLSRSSLLLDEEDEVLEEVEYLEIQPIKYKVISTYKTNYTLTRLEQKKKKYLLKEMDTLYQENNISKLTFLYEEIFPKDELSLYDKYLKLKEDIEDNYSNNHNKLYDIVRLTYIKK